MTNPDFLLECRCEITDALESIGVALGEARMGYDKAQDKQMTLADECAQNVQTHIDVAIRKLVEARDLARRSMMEEEA